MYSKRFARDIADWASPWRWSEPEKNNRLRIWLPCREYVSLWLGGLGTVGVVTHINRAHSSGCLGVRMCCLKAIHSYGFSCQGNCKVAIPSGPYLASPIVHFLLDECATQSLSGPRTGEILLFSIVHRFDVTSDHDRA